MYISQPSKEVNVWLFVQIFRVAFILSPYMTYLNSIQVGGMYAYTGKFIFALYQFASVMFILSLCM